MDRKLSRSVYTFIVATFMICIIVTVLFTQSLYGTSSSDLAKQITFMDIKGNQISTSGFIVSRDKTDGYLDVAVDSEGQTFYIYRDNTKFIKIGVFGVIIVATASIVLLFLMRYYNEKRILSALKPVERMSSVITDILSGESNEGDPEAVFDQIKPLLNIDGVKKVDLEKSIANLIEAEQRRREFTANVTHELKTPLTSINGYAEMILSGMASGEDTIKFASIIHDEGNRLLRLIDEILTLSKYDSASRDQVKYEEFDLYECVSNIIVDMSLYAKTEEINLNLNGENAIIEADKKLIIELVSNLISNAIKYNYSGGNVYIDVADGTDEVTIIVKDDGIGISKEDQERVFERFFMVKRSDGKKTGTGLGLALVKHIVKMHGGDIDLESELRKGSKFTIKLPKHKEV